MAQASVIIRPNQNLAKEWKGRLAESSQDLFAKSCASEARKSKRLIRSSFSGPEAPGAPEAALTTVSPSTNGLVKGIFEAYSGHHHLILRPEDIWFAILSQFSFYVNAHAEELRSLFVAHEGQEEITVYAVGNIDSVDIGGLAIDLTHEMEKHIVDESLRTWIIPSFTTTTTTDLITASILMMGTMQAYFKYTMMLLCGIPSITLLGGKEDWLDIRRRLEKLATFGEECELFGRLLIPVLDHLVLCFDSVDDPAVYDFWNKVCSHKFAGSGGDRLSGWITAFCFWDEKGKMLYWKQKNHDSEFSDIDVSDAHLFDASIYHSVGIDKIPPGTVSVPVKVNDNGTVYYTQMVAGSVGMRWTKSGQALDEIGEDHNCIQENESCTSLDTLQPISGWWMYELAATVQSEIQDYGIIIPPEQVSTLREIMSKMYHTNIEVDEPARNDIPYRPMGHKMLQANNHKVILLGTAGSGKTTLLRQLKLMNQGYTQDERNDLKEIIVNGTIQSMQGILEAMTGSGLILEEQSKPHARTVLDAAASSSDVSLAMKTLSKDPSTQACSRRLSDCSSGSDRYYFDNIERIFDRNYVPNDKDILLLDNDERVETSFKACSCTYQVFDVGAYKSEPKKWISCFQDVQMVIYMINISEYNELSRDSTMNRLEESLILFNTVKDLLRSPDITIFLILSGVTRFEECLLTSPLQMCFKDYEGGSDCSAAKNYIQARLRSSSDDSTWIDTVIVDVVDVAGAEQIKFVLPFLLDDKIEHNLCSS